MKTITEKALEEFCSLIENFLFKKINAPTFEKKYISLWNEYKDNNGEILYKINKSYDGAIDRIFTSVDAYCSDPALRGEYDIDEEQLRKEVKEQLLKVKPELEI